MSSRTVFSACLNAKSIDIFVKLEKTIFYFNERIIIISNQTESNSQCNFRVHCKPNSYIQFESSVLPTQCAPCSHHSTRFTLITVRAAFQSQCVRFYRHSPSGIHDTAHASSQSQRERFYRHSANFILITVRAVLPTQCKFCFLYGAVR